jgi:hypothetical protein
MIPTSRLKRSACWHFKARTMHDLDSYYAHLLAVGFVVMRLAAESANRKWLDAEFELLHNVPSLIGEGNAERHKYFWNQERAHYIQWASGTGRENAKSRMLTYYQPIWNEMEPVVEKLLGKSGAA